MSGEFTRKLYDDCAFDQNAIDSTTCIGYQMDPSKFINCSISCPPGLGSMVDFESSMLGLDQIASSCTNMRYPFVNNSANIKNQNVSTQANAWGRNGEKAVVNTNMRLPVDNGIKNNQQKMWFNPSPLSMMESDVLIGQLGDMNQKVDPQFVPIIMQAIQNNRLKEKFSNLKSR